MQLAAYVGVILLTVILMRLTAGTRAPRVIAAE